MSRSLEHKEQWKKYSCESKKKKLRWLEEKWNKATDHYFLQIIVLEKIERFSLSSNNPTEFTVTQFFFYQDNIGLKGMSQTCRVHSTICQFWFGFTCVQRLEPKTKGSMPKISMHRTGTVGLFKTNILQLSLVNIDLMFELILIKSQLQSSSNINTNISSWDRLTCWKNWIV